MHEWPEYHIQERKMVDTPYANYSLQYRDKDASKNWGGQIRQEEGRYVESLQKDLKALGVYIWKVDGDFGKKPSEL